ncbi:hypothetical protein [Pedobacter heparinus]|uniref:hypothetical protein n=1 Tax=Pedobacter heparinus TaxID=984 RepID=UPI00292DBD44|nr:hypothetical protein [Pedobacter heparinus]
MLKLVKFAIVPVGEHLGFFIGIFQNQQITSDFKDMSGEEPDIFRLNYSLDGFKA